MGTAYSCRCYIFNFFKKWPPYKKFLYLPLDQNYIMWSKDHTVYRPYSMQTTDNTGCRPNSPQIQSTDHIACRPYNLQNTQSPDYLVCQQLLVWELASRFPRKTALDLPIKSPRRRLKWIELIHSCTKIP